MNMQIKIENCPEGLVNGKCKTEDCIFQEGKWKGENSPTLTIDHKDKNEYVISCEDMEE
ncbi:MAG: hypothetical protein IPL26_12885 [Leptospiraceae bacterium]|nr:hypothetical protein [Leptospiraceae bacterium]